MCVGSGYPYVYCGGRWSDVVAVVVWIYSRQVLLSTVVMVWGSIQELMLVMS
jgi:hypothetical protein